MARGDVEDDRAGLEGAHPVFLVDRNLAEGVPREVSRSGRKNI
jgi:hypothetical protein